MSGRSFPHRLDHVAPPGVVGAPVKSLARPPALAVSLLTRSAFVRVLGVLILIAVLWAMILWAISLP